MQRYNIALLPISAEIQDTFIKVSRDYFLNANDQYILGPTGLPHITLCQFRATSDQHAIEIYDNFMSGESDGYSDVAVEAFNLRPGTLINSGKFIAEYVVKQEKALMAMQLRCSEILLEHNAQSLTPTKTYNPHITLARLSQAVDNIPSEEDLTVPLNMKAQLSLGISSEEGVFIKSLKK